MDRPSKEPVIRQDVVTGTFNGNEVTSAEIVFSSKWRFKGQLSFDATTISQKPIHTAITYDLTGSLSNPDESVVLEVKHLILKRTTSGENGSLETESFCFEAGRRTQDGRIINYKVFLSVDDDEWTTMIRRRIAPAVFFEGGEVSADVSGNGTLYVLASDDLREPVVYDKITGCFCGNEVHDARIDFASGCQFQGDVRYNIREMKDNPYSLDITYTLTGRLWDNKQVDLSFEEDQLTMSVKAGSIKLQPFTFDSHLWVPGQVVERYSAYIDNGSAAYCNVIYMLEQVTDGHWELSVKTATDNPEYIYPYGYRVTELKDGFSIQYPTTDYLEILNSRVVKIIKSFPEGIVHLDESISHIYYNDGGLFEGTFSINGIQSNTIVDSNVSDLATIMNPDTFLDECVLMYRDGIYTFPDGKTEKWENGITDYQQNKINGNYEKVTEAIEKARREEKAAKGAELSKKWDAALPELRRKYGKENVDAVYNYRLNRKSPLELFEDLARLGLIKLIGPIYSPNSKNRINEYVIYTTNRETGDIQYSLVLKFVHPFWSSPDWILDRYSSEFSY